MAGGRRWGGGGGGGAGAALAAAAFAALALAGGGALAVGALAGTCAADGAGWAGAGGGAVPLQRPPDMVGTAGSGRGAADPDEHAVFVSVADAPTSRVVVYTDRAEVTRAVTSVRVPAGRTRVTLWNVSALLVHESARVDGSALSSSSGGHGAPSVAVLEVSESRRMGVPAGAAPPLRQALERAQAALATAEAAVADAAERLKRAHRRSEMADTAVESALGRSNDGVGGSSASPLTRLTSEFASINELLDWADAQFDATMVAVGERRASLELAMRTRDARKCDVDAALAALDEPAAQSAQPGVKPLRRSKGPASSISAMVETSGPATLSLEFTYMVSGAQWAPTYDVRSSADPLAGGAGQAITVGYVASVTQSTGEDWASGELTLSTARPNVGASPPHLRRSTVGLHSVRAFEAYGAAGDSFAAQAEPMQRTSRARMVKRGSAELAMAAMDNSADGAGYEDAEEDEAVLFAEAVSFTSAVVAESGTSTEYVVADAAAVPCDGQPHRITIATMELASRMSYIAAPRAAAKAYLTVNTTNDSEFVMLPGIARVFQGNRFVASTHLPLTPAGGKLIVPFGTDDSVTVTAEPDKVIGDSKGFLINERTTSKQRHAMGVTNNKRVAVEVRVEDVVPDSSHEDVKVSVVEHTSEACAGCTLAFEHESKKQDAAWRLVLPPGAKQQLTLLYEVSWPKGKQVFGI